MQPEQLKYSVANGANGVGRFVRKLAAIAHHGARCDVCGRPYLVGERDEAAWQFAHIKAVGDQDDKSDRWGGRWRDEPLFTAAWWDFMDRTRLTCSQRCNKRVEARPMIELQCEEIAEDTSMVRMRQLELLF